MIIDSERIQELEELTAKNENANALVDSVLMRCSCTRGTDRVINPDICIEIIDNAVRANRDVINSLIRLKSIVKKED